MRLRGDYLAIVTLAFGEIIKNILNNLYVGLDASGLHFSMTDAKSLGMQGGTLLINGPQAPPASTRCRRSSSASCSCSSPSRSCSTS